MRIYEQLFIVRPDAAEPDIDALIGQLTAVVTESGGTVDKTDKWGARKLAYQVRRFNEGFYVLLQYHAAPGVVKELERRMRVSDLVLKYLTVRMDEKLKWLEKRQKARELRARRRPAPAVAMPAMPSEPGHPAPGTPESTAPAVEPAG